jgi:hypothetical protein
MKLFFKRILPVLIFFGVFSGEICAQYSFRHLGTAEGLIQGSNYYFLEDKQGFMWISSQGGLNRFDGHVVKRYVHDEFDRETISKGEIRGLAESPNGDIWMGTEVGLSRYHRKNNQFQNYFLQDKDGFDSYLFERSGGIGKNELPIRQKGDTISGRRF